MLLWFEEFFLSFTSWDKEYLCFYLGYKFSFLELELRIPFRNGQNA